MLCPDEIVKTHGGELFTDPADVHAEGVVVHIELVIPEVVNQIAPGTDFSGISKEIDKDLQFVFGELRSLSLIFQNTALRAQDGSPVRERIPASGTIDTL